MIFQIIGERRKTELLGLIFLIFDMYKTRTKPVQMRLEGCFGQKKHGKFKKKQKVLEGQAKTGFGVGSLSSYWTF
jgi:hypothetical protein